MFPVCIIFKKNLAQFEKKTTLGISHEYAVKKVCFITHIQTEHYLWAAV